MSLLIHMGVQKTGSTALHHFLQRNRDALAGRVQVLTPVKQSATRHLGRVAGLFSLNEATEADLVAAIRAVRDEINGPDTILSHENLPGAMPGRGGVVTLFPRIGEIMALLHRELSMFAPSFAVVTRDMPRWKQSVWGQAVRTDSYARTLPDFLEETGEVGDWEELATRMRAATSAPVHVLRIEDEADSARPGAQLLGLLGLRMDEIQALSPVEGRRNPSLNTGALEFMRLINTLELNPPARRKVAQLVEKNQGLFAST